MGKIDTVTTKYMSRNDVFADVFNFFIYEGKQVINPAHLVEIDTREIDVPYGGAEGNKEPVQKIRDVIKQVVAKTDNRAAYLVLAIENQANIHYAMAVKNMLYDALQYAKQVERAAASHKKSGDYKGKGSDQFLSGFMENDHLMPVVTLVIYWDAKQWDGPRSIHEMFRDQDQEILRLVPDYKINLIEPAAIDDDSFSKFSTNLREVLQFIKYSKDADKLKETVWEDDNFRHLGRAEVDVINACTNAKLKMQEHEEVLDVCEAIQTLNERAAEKATEKTKNSTLLQNVKSLMKTTGWPVGKTMDKLEISEADREVIMSLLQESIVKAGEKQKYN